MIMLYNLLVVYIFIETYLHHFPRRLYKSVKQYFKF